MTGEPEALLVDAGVHPRRRPPAGRRGPRLRQDADAPSFLSHGDPDFYFGAEVIADAFPDATLRRHPPTSSITSALLRGQAQGVGGPRREPADPPGRRSTPLTGDAHAWTAPPVRAPGRRRRAARPALPVAGRAPRASSAGSCCSSRRARLGRRHRHPRAAHRVDRPARRDGRPSTRNSSSPATALPRHRDRPDARSAAPATTCAPSTRNVDDAADGAALDRGAGRRLPGRRHADRRPARRQGRQRRDDMGLSAPADQPTRSPPPPPPMSCAGSTSRPRPVTSNALRATLAPGRRVDRDGRVPAGRHLPHPGRGHHAT